MEAGVPGKNPRAQAGDHHTLSQSTTVDQMDRTRVVAVLRDYFVHCATWTPNHNRSHANQALVKVTSKKIIRESFLAKTITVDSIIQTKYCKDMSQGNNYLF